MIQGAILAVGWVDVQNSELAMIALANWVWWVIEAALCQVSEEMDCHQVGVEHSVEVEWQVTGAEVGRVEFSSAAFSSRCYL